MLEMFSMYFILNTVRKEIQMEEFTLCYITFYYLSCRSGVKGKWLERKGNVSLEREENEAAVKARRLVEICSMAQLKF